MGQTLKFNVAIDGAPYIIKAVPCQFNSDTQYRVNINDAEEVMFAFNPALGRYAAIGDDALNVPDNVEIVIGGKLNSSKV